MLLPTKQPPSIRTSNSASYCAFVTLQHCLDFRFGGINDEVLLHHPLQGLDYYTLHEVHHSLWLAELHKINAYHFSYSPTWWEDYHHYFFTFHDDSFECIAKGYTTEVHVGSIKNITKLAFAKMFG